MLEARYAYDEIEGFLLESFHIVDDILADEFRIDVLRRCLAAEQLLREAQQFLGDIHADVLDLDALELSELGQEPSAATSEFEYADRLLSAVLYLLQENARIVPMLIPRVVVLFRVGVIEARQ